MAWTVKTLKTETFTQTCAELESTVRDSGFEPDAVLSIANGGVHVGREIFAGKPHFTTALKRPSTIYKKRIIRIIIRLVPRFLQNRLRIIEARILNRKKAGRATHTLRKVTIPEEMNNISGNILIVDDAVDSGRTLKSVTEAVRCKFPEAMVRTAVITVTTDNPEIAPDYALFRNRILIRFPWSIDA